MASVGAMACMISMGHAHVFHGQNGAWAALRKFTPHSLLRGQCCCGKA